MFVIHKDLKLVLVKEYNEIFEFMVEEVMTQNIPIRVITGYGPQESWKEVEKILFWIALKEEIASAELCGISVIIQMDANVKLG